MSMTCNRSPASCDGCPPCWARHLPGTAECAACAWEWRCARYTSRVNRRFTVREEVRRRCKPPGKPPHTPESLAKFVKRAWVGAGGQSFPKWWDSAKHAQAFAAVLAGCAASGGDPEEYVQAQIDTTGKAALASGRRSMAAGCFAGPNADARYARWRAARGRTRCTILRLHAWEAHLAEWAEYGARVISKGQPEDQAAEGLPLLSPAPPFDACLEGLRWFGLAAGLDALVPNLSDRIMVPQSWTFSAVAEFAWSVSGFGSVESQLDLDALEGAGLGSFA